jgi:PAS domain S-box-containing protein
MSGHRLTVALRETLSLFDDPGTPRTTTEIADRLDVGRRSAYDRLQRLADRGRIRTKEVGANARVWWLPPPRAATSPEAEETLPDLVSGIPAILYRCRDAPGRPMTFVSDAVERITGYDTAEVESGAVEWGSDVVHPEDRAPLGQAIGTQLADDTRFTVEYRIRTADGDTRWVRERGRVVPDGGSEHPMLEGIVTDVTGNRDSTGALAAREQQFRSLVEATEEYAIFLLDPEGRIRTWNRGARRIKGYRAEEIVGRHVSTFYTASDRETGVPRRNLRTAAEEGVYEEEGWRVRADGSRFWAHVTITAVEGRDGTPAGYAKVTRDMTDRRLAEQRLRDEKAFVEGLFETQRDVIYALDAGGGFVRWNNRLSEVTGYTDVELQSLSFPDLVPETAAEEATAAFERVVDDGASVTVQLPLELVDGSTVPHEFTAAPVTEGGRVVGITGIGRDVSERKRRQREIERQRDDVERELREVFDRVDDAFFAIDDDWRFTHVNERAETLLDRSVGELIGRRLDEAFPEAVGSVFERKYQRAFETQEPVTFEAYYDPLETWFEVTAYPSDSGLSVYFRDVTDRKAREQELERYETIIETVEDGIYVVDEDGRFTLVNSAYETLVGQSREELLGAHVSSVIPDSDIVERAKELEAELAAGERTTATLEAELPGTTDETRFGEATFSLLPSTEGFERVGVVRDVTDRKERERELLRQRKQLAALNNLNRVVRDVIEAVIEQSTQSEIETVVCERLASADSYEFAWIGGADATDRTVHVRTEAGVEGYLDDLTISVDPDDDRSEGPTGRALRTGEIQTTRDIGEGASDLWPAATEEYGSSSSAAVPISHEDAVYGVLNVYTDRENAFEGAERTVIEQLGEVVGHALAAHDRKEALMNDAVVELEFYIPDVFDALDIGERAAGQIRIDHASSIGGDRFLIYGTADASDADAVRAIADAIPHWETVVIREQDDRDRVRFEARLSEPPVMSVVASVGGALECAVVEDGDYSMTVHTAPTADVGKIISAVQTAYPEAQLLKRRQTSRDDDPSDDVHRLLGAEVTDRQRAVLEAAHYAGFFDVPRQVSGAELAESFDISAPTFHTHLRKAERAVFERLFSSSRLVST